jgi:hypothetical protein
MSIELALERLNNLNGLVVLVFDLLILVDHVALPHNELIRQLKQLLLMKLLPKLPLQALGGELGYQVGNVLLLVHELVVYGRCFPFGLVVSFHIIYNYNNMRNKAEHQIKSSSSQFTQ